MVISLEKNIKLNYLAHLELTNKKLMEFLKKLDHIVLYILRLILAEIIRIN
ncbi:MAG: Asp-tRNA(Asn)/Glu-tRNA(Gln) amidotransferase C subunit [Francisellaceae bacterium]|jgi:Asp-tRNA(Asn)/Glu-tRNA(Gln) amidotransferase C subunit